MCDSEICVQAKFYRVSSGLHKWALGSGVRNEPDERGKRRLGAQGFMEVAENKNGGSHQSKMFVGKKNIQSEPDVGAALPDDQFAKRL